MAVDGASTIEHLRWLLASSKSIPTEPTWRRMNDRGRLELVSALDIDGVSAEGFELRMIALETLPQRDVTCLLVYRDAWNRGGPVERIDWRPLRGHNNKGLGPKAFRHKLLRGSHHHRLADNSRLGWPGFSQRNLPVAIPLDDDPEDFDGLLALMRDKFDIADAISIPAPPWSML